MVKFDVAVLNVANSDAKCRFTECHYTECIISNVVMLNVAAPR